MNRWRSLWSSVTAPRQWITWRSRGSPASTGAGAGFRIKMGGDWLEAESVVMACEAHSAQTLLGAVDTRLTELLGTVPYSSSMTVVLGFESADFGPLPKGFGFLVPRKERRRLV